MAYSSSEFDDDVDTIGDGIEPYLFEPLATDADYEGGSEINDTEENLERLMDRNWCTYGICQIMPTVTECLCCCEIDKVENKMDGGYSCIVEHPGFDAVCLNVWVLQTAYYTLRKHYGSEAY